MVDYNRKTALYRCFDSQRKLLYVGASGNPLERLRQHKATADWVFDCVTITLEWFEHKHLAHKAELAAIQAEQPMYNTAGKTRKRHVVIRLYEGWRKPRAKPMKRTVPQYDESKWVT